MGKLIYSAIASLDGYVEDESGGFSWAVPDAEVHAYINELERPIGTYLYGRRMYETMVYWETVDDHDSEETRDYARIWRDADKIVYSQTLESPSSERTGLEQRLDPAGVTRLKESSERDLSIGGAEIAGHAMRLGLVDECHLLLCPVLVGGGKRALPDGIRSDLSLVDERRFEGGVVHLHYRVRG